MSAAELEAWVRDSAHLGRFASTLREHEMDGLALSLATTQDLLAAGLPLGAALKLKHCADRSSRLVVRRDDVNGARTTAQPSIVTYTTNSTRQHGSDHRALQEVACEPPALEAMLAQCCSGAGDGPGHRRAQTVGCDSLPDSCAPACAAVYVPFYSMCPQIVSSFGNAAEFEQFFDQCRTVQPPPGPPPPPPGPPPPPPAPLHCAAVSRDSVVFDETVYEKHLANPPSPGGPGMAHLILAGDRPDFIMSTLLSVGFYQHTVITSEVTDAALSFAEVGANVRVKSTGRLTINGTFASVDFLGPSLTLDAGVSLILPTLERLTLKETNLEADAHLSIAISAGVINLLRNYRATIEPGASVVIAGGEIQFGEGSFMHFKPGSTLALAGMTDKTTPLNEPGTWLDDYGSSTLDTCWTNGNCATLGGAVFSIIWSSSMQGQATITDFTVTDPAGQALYTMNGESPGDMQLDLTAAGLTYFDTALASGVVTRAADGTETSAWSYLGKWESGTVTNRAGNTFTLFLLPAQVLTSDAAGSTSYRAACEEHGWRTVGTGVGGPNNYYETCAPYNCMPLPGAFGYGSEGIYYNTGWGDLAVHHHAYADQLTMRSGSGQTSSDLHTWEWAKRPVCALEN
jgi:hypothetical protein